MITDQKTEVCFQPLRKAALTGDTIRMLKPKHLGTSKFSFAKFVATYFNPQATAYHSLKPLKQPLLEYGLPLDAVAAKTIWIIILRFMDDIVEDGYESEEITSSSYTENRASMMKRLIILFSKSVLQNGAYQATDGMCNDDNSNSSWSIQNTLKDKTKLPDLLQKTFGNEQIVFYKQILKKSSSDLEKLHFIVGHGILRPTLRDEILAQICKQLTKNPTRTSFAKGWLLLSLCLGCFTPSKHFENVLRCFIRNGPPIYASLCEQRLNRTLQNGTRTEPTSWLELLAARTNTPITLVILLADGYAKELRVDSATTAREAVQQLAAHIGLLDYFGFSIVISISGKIFSLGSGNEHILDAISYCEQYAREQGDIERSGSWKLYFRKEMFSAWYDPNRDPLATHLIYKQITCGLNSSEYRCRTVKEIIMICALAYYVEYGAKLDRDVLRKFIPNSIPRDILNAGEQSLRSWEILIAEAFAANEYVRSRTVKQQAMADICSYAQLTWSLYFSRYFEAVRIAGPTLLTDIIIIAINSSGIYYIDGTEQVLAEISYAELRQVTCISMERSNIDELHIDTVQDGNFTFKCYDAADIVELINFILNKLKTRSKYGIVIEDYKPTEAECDVRLGLRKGDLVQFGPDTVGAHVLEARQRWLPGVCNDEEGVFPAEIVNVLATLTKPSQNILQIYRECAENMKGQDLNSVEYTTVQCQHRHTLREFADQHFREDILSDESSQSQLHLHLANSTKEELWRYSHNMLKAPLLKTLQGDPDIFQKALVIFYYISKYMDDALHGTKGINIDFIFKPALEQKALCNEFYCQLMKQLTGNRLQRSEERGWDLMYLATGIAYPGPLVMRELLEFLNTHPHIMAAKSLKRLKRTLANGHRKRPPHAIEVEGIQQRFKHIYHKIYFPDGSIEAFEVDSFKRAHHITQDVAKRFKLKSHEGYGMFAIIGKKVFAIPENEFIFDFIKELEEWLKFSSAKRSMTLFCFQYQLYCIKKLWWNVVPGWDMTADMIFHYPQELPKYLSGYYEVNKELAAKMAGLIYVVGFGANIKCLHNITDILQSLVPEDLIARLGVNEWRTLIIQCVSALLEENVNEGAARARFLKFLAEQQMFGSTFFLVKQNSGDQNLPETILIAINKNGFHIIHPGTKDILQSHAYTDLSIWSSGNEYFHIRFGNMIGSSKLLCTTTQGHKMNDLISSYVKYFNKKL